LVLLRQRKANAIGGSCDYNIHPLSTHPIFVMLRPVLTSQIELPHLYQSPLLLGIDTRLGTN